MEESTWNCCKIDHQVIELTLVSDKDYKYRKIFFSTCHKCGKTWLFKEFTLQNGQKEFDNITKKQTAEIELSIYQKQAIKPLEYKQHRMPKPDPAPGLTYLKGEDGTIRKLNDNIIEHFQSEILTSEIA